MSGFLFSFFFYKSLCQIMFDPALFWLVTFSIDFCKISLRSLASCGINLCGKFCNIEIYLHLFLLFAESSNVVIQPVFTR